MPLPLNLAMTPSEIAATQTLPADFAWMACHFSSDGTGLENLPMQLPEGAMLILDDSIPCSGHSADVIVQRLCEVVSHFHCGSVLLDFQRSESSQISAIAATLVDALPCPIAVTPEYARTLTCAVFLPPAPLHMPLEKHLRPWKNREIWLEAALSQERITVTKKGAIFTPIFPTQQLTGGFYEERLCCRYHTTASDDSITFTLFDAPETLEQKLALAHSLGVARAVGLYQELGTFLTGK